MGRLKKNKKIIMMIGPKKILHLALFCGSLVAGSEYATMTLEQLDGFREEVNQILSAPVHGCSRKMPKVAGIKTVKDCDERLPQLYKLFSWQSEQYKNREADRIDLPATLTKASKILSAVDRQLREKRDLLKQKENCQTLDRLCNEIGRLVKENEKFEKEDTKKKAHDYLKAIMSIYGPTVPEYIRPDELRGVLAHEFNPYGFDVSPVSQWFSYNAAISSIKEFQSDGKAWLDALKRKFSHQSSNDQEYFRRAHELIVLL